MYLFQSASCKGLAVTVLSPIFEQGQMTSCYFCCDISTPRSPKQKNQHTWPLLRGVKASATEYHNYEVHHGSLANNQHQQPETDQQLENSSMGRSKFLQILQDWALLAHNWTMYNCLAAPAGLRQSAPGWFPWIRLMLPSASCGLQHVARFHWQKCSLLLQVPIEQQHAMSPLTFNSPGCIRPIVRSDSL